MVLSTSSSFSASSSLPEPSRSSNSHSLRATTTTPSATTNTTNNTTTTASHSLWLAGRVRRSARVLEHDPIVAPGFGTQKDLQRLTQQLNQIDSSSSSSSIHHHTNNNNTHPPSIFTVEAIELLMKAQGRGLGRSSRRRRSDDDASGAATTTAATATASSNAWAEWMMEEGLTTNTNTTTTATTPPPRARTSERSNQQSSTAAAGKATATATSQQALSSSGTKRTYQLDTLHDNVDDNSTSVPTKKKGKTKGRDGTSNSRTSTTTTTTTTNTTAGILLQAGTLDAALVGRGKLTKAPAVPLAACPIPTRILPHVRITKVFTGCNAVHSIALDGQGTAYGWGRNEVNQLGIMNHNNNSSSSDVGGGGGGAAASTKVAVVPVPTRLDLPGRLHQAALGKSHTLFLLTDGTVWSVGANKVGQCGVRTYTDVTHYRKCVWPDALPAIRYVACGEDFSVVLDAQGYLYSTGSSEFGQLGNGETGEHFVSANKIAFANANVLTRRTTFCHAPHEKLHMNNEPAKVVPLGSGGDDDGDVRLQAIACGKHHTIALEAASDQKPRIFTWGCGNYGCLGHGIQADEYFPRQVGVMNTVALGVVPTSSSTTLGEAASSSSSSTNAVVKIAAGTHCSLVQTPNGHVYYWGKHRSVGEATMRPSLVDVLANNQHVVQHVAAGGQTVVCSTSLRQTVAWGQGPYGELGLGSAKSSSKPTFIESLDGCQVLDVACGYGHSLFVVQEDDGDDDDAEDSPLQKLPEIDSAVVEQLQTVVETKPAKASKKKGK